MAHDVGGLEKIAFLKVPGRVAPDPEDKKKLARVRTAEISLSARVTLANRIHDLEMRDAGLGNLIKRHMREVLKTPARMSQLQYEQAELFEITDMMIDPSKRESMLKRVKSMGSK